jgi:orotate phosphoribosyltransferase
MQSFQHDFIEFALKNKALQLGEFTLKSGRKSPYFFNTGVFCTGEALATLAQFYQIAIQHHGFTFDCLVGPAYKGIPLVSAVSCIRALQYGEPTPFAFNRKEVKDHGEGGQWVGTALSSKRVLLLDDVITAGTAVRELLSLLKQAGAQLTGILVALDREENNNEGLPALAALSQTLQVKVASIVRFSDILEFVENHADYQFFFSQIKAYQTGANT